MREGGGGLPPRLLVFGHGFVGQALACAVCALGWDVVVTVRRAPASAGQVLFDGSALLPPAALAGVTHILSTIPPTEDGDPVLPFLTEALRRCAPRWVGYVSSTAVYGDHQGGWVDETTPPTPQDARSLRRWQAEQVWLGSGLPVHIFRAAGIYGPGRSALDTVRQGRARRIIKPGQVFGRVHVDDIVQILLASMAQPHPGAVYNMADDEPAPPQDVIAFACQLLGVDVPPDQPWDEVKDSLSPMTLFFYQDNKRVSNGKVKDELGVVLRYPDYRRGLTALWEQENANGRDHCCGGARVAP